MRKKLVESIAMISVLAGFMLFGWGSPSLVTELKEEDQALKARIEVLEEKVESQKKIIERLRGELGTAIIRERRLEEDLYKVCLLERKMIRPVYFPREYDQLHSLVTKIIKKRGYEIRGQGGGEEGEKEENEQNQIFRFNRFSCYYAFSNERVLWRLDIEI